MAEPPQKDHRMATPWYRCLGVGFFRLLSHRQAKKHIGEAHRMSATPSNYGSHKSLGQERVGPAPKAEAQEWTARNTLMFLVGATGLLWAGVYFFATLIL